MPLTITNPYRLRMECLRNVSPYYADLAGRIVVAVRTEALSLPTVTLIEELFDHLDKIASQQRGSVKCLSVWMSGLVYAKALLITDVERFLADAAALGGPSSVGPA